MGIFSSSKKPGREFINLDGTPYENRFLHPFVRPVADFISLPSSKIGVVTAFGFAAVEACAHKDMSIFPHSLAINFADVLVMQALCMFLDRRYQNAYEKQEGCNIAIDKSGWPSLDKAQAKKIAVHLKGKANLKLGASFVSGLMGITPTASIISGVWDMLANKKLESRDMDHCYQSAQTPNQ